MKQTDLIGSKLPNGTTILAIHIGPTKTGVVLAEVRPDEWATWEFYRDDLASTSHGHYFHGEDRALQKATVNYVERVGRSFGVPVSLEEQHDD